MRTACLGVLLTLCALGLAPPARAFDVAEIGRAEMLAEVPGGAPVEGEMVRLRLRAIFKGRIALAELRQPALTNVSWSQLGRDATLEEQFHGFTVPGVERDLALFPQRSGTVTIPPGTTPAVPPPPCLAGTSKHATAHVIKRLFFEEHAGR